MSKSDNVSNTETPQNNFTPRQGWFSGLSQSPGAKFIITGIITVMLMIPALLVWGLVEERADRAENVASSISNGWGESQAINGPYLVVPYKATINEIKRINQKNTSVETEVLRYAIYSPERVSTTANIEVTERKKSIYSVPLYHMGAEINGEFGALDFKPITDLGGTPLVKNAFLAMGIADPAGFRSEVLAKIGNRKSEEFLPGLKGIKSNKTMLTSSARYAMKHINGSNSQGIHLPVSKIQAESGFEFDIKMALNGSRVLAFVPNGKNTKLKVDSNWAHPGFAGRFLPKTREIGESGFNANWTIPNLARGIDAVSLSSQLPQTSSIQINFVEPLKFYQVVSRTLKYAIAFFALIFLAVFILELMGKKAIHWIQYILVGLAMVIFYIMLLAMAEHIGFNLAYIISALATTILISWYVGNSLGQKNGMAIMGSILGIMYAIIFLVLKEQEYALLAGSIIAFAAIAVTMYATRDVSWSNHQKTITD